MRTGFHDLFDAEYEALIVAICSFLLGDGVQGFTKGADGGKDGKFTGTANSYPSQSKPWSGKIIIQAKHTTSPIGLFSDSEFSGKDNKTSILNKEIPRINSLLKNQELDYYMLFSNRKLGGTTEISIKQFISSSTGLHVDRIALIDSGNLELLLNKHGQAYKVAGISPLSSALQIFPEELAELIDTFVKHRQLLVVNQAMQSSISQIQRTNFQAKNQINGLSAAYAKSIIRDYFMDFDPIRDFLAAPQNEKFLNGYTDTTDDFNFKLRAERHKFENFDSVLNELFDKLRVADEIFKKNLKLTRTFLFYMYWNCDLGENVDALSD